MKILVTAFDPFGGETVNPAQLALERLPDRIGGHTLVKRVVPTVFGLSGDLVTGWMKELRPGAVVCLGQAGGRAAVTAERVAINIMDAAKPDNAGFIPTDLPVVPGGPAAYFSTLPIKAMAAVSNTAGTFVCNQLLYRILHHAAVHMPACRCGFLHVPYIPEQTAGKPGVFSMELDEIVAALEKAIGAI